MKDDNTVRSRKLVLNRETLRELDPESLDQVAGGDIDITTVVTIAETIAQTIGMTISIIASSPCSNVYSRCRTCTA